MNDDLYAHYKTTVGAVAREIGRHYLSFTSLPDVENELWILIFERADSFRAYMETATVAYVALKRAAHAFCEEQRAAALGGAAEPLLYSPNVVRELLPDCFDYEDWQSFSQKADGMPRAQKIEATGDRISMLIDIKTAVDKLGSRDYSIIIGKYKLQWSDTELAEMLEIEPQSVRSQVSRSVRALVALMNPTDSGHEYVATRRVKSNAAARAELDNSW